MNVDIDSKCIPLAHIQTYFDLRKGILHDVNWLEKRTKLQMNNPHEIIEVIVGINPDDFYRNAGIDYRGDTSAIFISPRQCLMLIDQAMKALDMPFLGLAMGNLMTISHHGMAGVAAVTQPTLFSCLECISRFCSELFPPLEMYTQQDGDEGMFIITENVSLSPYAHFFFELNMISFYNIFNYLVGDKHKLYGVDFSYPEPAWGHIYRRYFHCPVRFNQPLTRLYGSIALADYELPLANRLLAMSAEKVLFENIPTRAARMLPLRLRRLLMRYYGAFPSLDTAASDLGMSARTLSRKLAEDGTTYQKELDDLREKLAKEYFFRGGDSVTQVALMLGYTDISNFSKAFKRWTGLTPTEFMETNPI